MEPLPWGHHPHPPISHNLKTDTPRVLEDRNFKTEDGRGALGELISESQPLDYELAAYDYELPPEHIAQNPVVPRDSSRLLVVQSPTEYSHQIFRELGAWLRSGDLLVLNNTKVFPARLLGRKPQGAVAEVLLLEPQQPDVWLALVKPGRRLPPGSTLHFASPDGSRAVKAMIQARDLATGGRILHFELMQGTSLAEALEYLGEIPFPPYVMQSQAQPEQYQTVYAQRSGSVAAPTAGLHFTPELLDQLQTQGIHQTSITLHVGVGTFRPVNTTDIRQHLMHSEWVEIPQETVDLIHQTQAQGGRIIAVGTTVVRALEAVAEAGKLKPYRGKTDVFIYPGYQWQIVQGLITNFHLPRSSLMMLVSAFIGRQRLLALYQEAIAQGYQFYSFGDAMLILPEAKMPRRNL